MLPLKDNVPSRSTPIVTIGPIAASFVAVWIAPQLWRRPEIPRSRFPVS